MSQGPKQGTRDWARYRQSQGIIWRICVLCTHSPGGFKGTPSAFLGNPTLHPLRLCPCPQHPHGIQERRIIPAAGPGALLQGKDLRNREGWSPGKEELLVPRTRCGLGPWQTSDWGYRGLCHKPALLPRTLAYQKAVDLWPLQVSFNTPHTSSGLGRSHPSTVLVLSPCTWPGPWAEASLPCDSELGVRLGG